MKKEGVVMKKVILSFVMICIGISMMAGFFFKDYNALREFVIELINENRYQEAVQVLIAHQDMFPDKQFNITMNMAMIYKEMGEDEKVIDALLDGNSRDVIYPIDIGSPMFSYLEDNERYLSFLNKNIELRECASEIAEATLLIIAPDDWGNNTYPLMIALHGGMGSNEAFEKQWVTDKMRGNYIIALIQSSQVFTNDTYYWENLEIGRRDIDSMIAKLNKKYNYDKNNIIIGGFSHGGRMALDYAQHSPMNIVKIITLCPGPDLPNEEFEAYSNSDIIIITGSKDHSIEFQRSLRDRLNNAGINTIYVEFEDMGHMFTEDFYITLDQHL